MLSVHRTKKSNQIVFIIGKAGSNHSLCLFPFVKQAKSGNWGVVQPVKHSNLVEDRSVMYGQTAQEGLLQ